MRNTPHTEHATHHAQNAFSGTVPAPVGKQKKRKEGKRNRQAHTNGHEANKQTQTKRTETNKGAQTKANS